MGSTVNKNISALIVDDDSDTVTKTMKYLSRNGFKVQVVENGQKAVELFQANNHFDLVVMDMDMPIMDGFQATKEIRALGVQTLIIGMSESTSQARVQEFISAGLDNFYPKPMNMAKLIAILGHFN